MLFHKNPDKLHSAAIIQEKRVVTFDQLSVSATALAVQLQGLPRFSRVGIYIIPSPEFVVALLGIWRAGHIAVPLCLSHPEEELGYVIGDASISTVVKSRTIDTTAFGGLESELSWLIADPDESGFGNFIIPEEAAPALMVYTSGTTNRPKGVVLSHGNIKAQVSSLSEAWGWSSGDCILNVLPLHHVHGLINILCCALHNYACCVFQTKFDPVAVWNWFGKQDTVRRPTLFMAVPTIYSKLIAAWESASEDIQVLWSSYARHLRLMVSGSAALPASLWHKWERITGQQLLERYGMTEIGMALSNPLSGIRKPGFVGKPLPGVNVSLRQDGKIISKAGEPGELFVRGETVFREYWNKPESTKAAFTQDGWFMTGDIALFDSEGDYQILGRHSQDIIKSGGYKISALEIETALLNHTEIAECAVIGIPDEEWGERIAAAVVPKSHVLSDEELKQFLKKYLAQYKIPSRWFFTSSLPRNAMGKVVKPDLKARLIQG